MPSGQISPELFDVKINMLILILHVYTLSICIWSRRLKLYLRKWSLIQMSLKKHSLGLASILTTQWLAQINHFVLYIYVNAKLLRNQSWVRLLFSVSWDLILDLILYNWFSILPSRGNQEPRIETRNRLSTYCSVKLLTNWGFISNLSPRLF